jgi:hypothetical protein
MPQMSIDAAGKLFGHIPAENWGWIGEPLIGELVFSVAPGSSKRLSVPEGRDGHLWAGEKQYVFEPIQQPGQRPWAEYDKTLATKPAPLSAGLLTIHEGGRYTAVERQP